MGIFRQFPYTNFHEMNMDELIKIVRELADDWVEYQQEWGNLYDDVSSAFEQFKADMYEFFNEFDPQSYVNVKIESMLLAGTFNPIIRQELSPYVTAWLDQNITEPTGVVIDSSLTVASACADAKAAGDRITDNLRELILWNSFDLSHQMNKNYKAQNGITFTWNPDGSCTIFGTSSGIATYDLFFNANSLPANFTAGESFEIKYSSSKVAFIVYDYTGGNITKLIETKTTDMFKLPDNCSGLIIRLWIGAGESVNETINPVIIKKGRTVINADMDLGTKPSSIFSSANDINFNCRMFVSLTNDQPSINNVPYAPGWLETCIVNGLVLQRYYPLLTSRYPVMFRTKFGSWSEWTSINDTGYIEAVDHELTSDMSNVTDMYLRIQLALNQYKYCKLGPGIFYIDSTLYIKEGCTLEGCGDSTKIVLMPGNAKYAINIHDHGALRNLSILGDAVDLAENDFGETSGSRYGLFFRKGYPDYSQPCDWCNVENVSIKNFTGSGIYHYETGANVKQGLYGNNISIRNCWAGIHIAGSSEFNRYDNTQVTYCKHAIINNGGNNSFNNCVIHGYATGFKIIGNNYNSGHGICSNSSICHCGGNAIDISDCENGYIFANLQIWYNPIVINNSRGIIINSCEFSRSQRITVTSGDTVLISNCLFIDDIANPPIISKTAKTKMVNCFGAVSGNVIS